MAKEKEKREGVMVRFSNTPNGSWGMIQGQPTEDGAPVHFKYPQRQLGDSFTYSLIRFYARTISSTP